MHIDYGSFEGGLYGFQNFENFVVLLDIEPRGHVVIYLTAGLFLF